MIQKDHASNIIVSWGEEFKDTKMTSPAATLTDLEATAFNETSNIHYSRPATIFAAVAASIFTFVGITGKKNI